MFYKLFKKLENEKEEDLIESQIPFYTPFIEQKKILIDLLLYIQ